MNDRFNSSDLTRRILAATSGCACGRAEELLAARVDGDLEIMDHALLAAHLTRCAPCRQLAEAMAWSLPLLPQLSERDPGFDFTAAVLARTTRRSAPAPVAALERGALAVQAWATRQAWRLAGLMQRPRIALEAAWVGAALVAILIWSPLAPSGAAEQAVAAVQSGSSAVPQLVRDASGLASDVPQLGGALIAPVRGRLDSTVRGLRERASRFEARGHSLWHSIFGGPSGETTTQNDNSGA